RWEPLLQRKCEVSTGVSTDTGIIPRFVRSSYIGKLVIYKEKRVDGKQVPTSKEEQITIPVPRIIDQKTFDVAIISFSSAALCCIQVLLSYHGKVGECLRQHSIQEIPCQI